MFAGWKLALVFLTFAVLLKRWPPLLVGLGGILGQVIMYQRRSVSRSGFSKLLYRVIDTLKEGPEIAVQRAHQLSL